MSQYLSTVLPNSLLQLLEGTSEESEEARSQHVVIRTLHAAVVVSLTLHLYMPNTD